MEKKRQKKVKADKNSDLRANLALLGGILAITFFFFFLFYMGKKIYASDSFCITEVLSNVNLEDSLVENIKGQSLFTFNFRDCYNQIAKLHPEYKQVRLIKTFPNALKVEVLIREPLAQIRINKFYLIDKEAVVLTDGQNEPWDDFIIIEIPDYNRHLQRGKNIDDKRLDYAFRLMQALNKSEIYNDYNVSKINVGAISLVNFFVDDAKVILGEGDYDKKLYFLENILKQKLDNTFSNVEQIDLRYSKVYIEFKTTQSSKNKR